MLNAQIQSSSSFIFLLSFHALSTQIIQVTAVDLDTGNNARLTYRIVGGDHNILQHLPTSNNITASGTTAAAATSTATTKIASKSTTSPGSAVRYSDDISELFGIFPNSGWIYLRGTLDRETRDRYDITVMASDNGTPSASATTHVIVNVLDANDNDPQFSRDSYQFSVEENMRRGAIIGIVTAADSDIDANAAIRYSLIPSNTSFQVNPVTGEPTSLLSIFLSFW